ncbi:MAG: hypothetical protein AAB354_15945 [candidate division KSB1 bacterium]|mgnify:FL=1
MNTSPVAMDAPLQEFIIKTEPQVFQNFQQVSKRLYDGNESVALREAVQALIASEKKRDTSRLKAIIDKIRFEVEAAGGLTSKQIDQLVRESRQRRRAARQ